MIGFHAYALIKRHGTAGYSTLVLRSKLQDGALPQRGFSLAPSQKRQLKRQHSSLKRQIIVPIISTR
jgi:hypothetical protein